MRPSNLHAAIRVSVGVACAIAAVTLVAGPGLAAPRHASRKHRHPAAHGAAMRAVVDPATGRLGPSARVSDQPGSAAAAPLAPATAPVGAAQVAQPVVRTLSDGTNVVALPADQMEYEVARVGKDGKLERACVHGNPKAATFAPKREAQ